MFAEFGVAISSIKSIIDIARLSRDRKITDQVIEKTIELNSAILGLQEKMSKLQAENDALIQEKKDLAQKIADNEKWQNEAARYQLNQLATNVFVYSLKENANNEELPHFLCPNCFQNKAKAILHRRAKTVKGTIYTCMNCKSDYIDHHHPKKRKIITAV